VSSASQTSGQRGCSAIETSAILELRRGAMGRAAGVVRRVAGPRLGNPLGLWVDLRDILFVAALRQ